MSTWLQDQTDGAIGINTGAAMHGLLRGIRSRKAATVSYPGMNCMHVGGVKRLLTPDVATTQNVGAGQEVSHAVAIRGYVTHAAVGAWKIPCSVAPHRDTEIYSFTRYTVSLPVVEGRSCFDIGIMTATCDIGRVASSSYLALFKANVNDMTALIDCDMTLL